MSKELISREESEAIRLSTKKRTPEEAAEVLLKASKAVAEASKQIGVSLSECATALSKVADTPADDADKQYWDNLRNMYANYGVVLRSEFLFPSPEGYAAPCDMTFRTPQVVYLSDSLK